MKRFKDLLFEKEIGRGAFATVYLGRHEKLKKQVAIKEIDLSNRDPNNQDDKKHIELFLQEMDILKKLNHPNIIKMLDFYRTTKKIYMVLEYCSKGDLQQFLRKSLIQNYFDEKEAKPIILQLIDALNALQEQNIVHRDLKLANILIDEQNMLKLADFGFARFREEHQLLTSFCGSPITMAPEILRRIDGYDNMADIWSLGVIMYYLVCGKYPFHPGKQSSLEDLINFIQTSDLVFPEHIKLTNSFKDLVQKMLQKDPKIRIPIQKIIQHPWVNSYEENPLEQSCAVFQSVQQVTPEEEDDEDDEIYESLLDQEAVYETIMKQIAHLIKSSYLSLHQARSQLLDLEQSQKEGEVPDKFLKIKQSLNQAVYNIQVIQGSEEYNSYVRCLSRNESVLEQEWKFENFNESAFRGLIDIYEQYIETDDDTLLKLAVSLQKLSKTQTILTNWLKIRVEKDGQKLNDFIEQNLKEFLVDEILKEQKQSKQTNITINYKWECDQTIDYDEELELLRQLIDNKLQLQALE